VGLAERIFDGLRASLEMRGEIDRLTSRMDGADTTILDHEKRLIRIETMIEMSQARAARDQLPDRS
jgi:hypothetical protein